MPSFNFLQYLRIPNVIRTLGDRIWDSQFEHTAPPIRYMDIAFVSLRRHNTKTGQDDSVGSFVPELYELANTPLGSLKCQWQEREWREKGAAEGNILFSEDSKRILREANTLSEDYKRILREANPGLYGKLYRPDGQRKSAFELALIPSERLTDIHTVVKREYKHRRDQGLALPTPISKLRVLPDYLESLKDSGLKIKEYPNAIKLNLRNPHESATIREKILHFLEWPAAVLITLSAAVALSGFASSWAIAAGIVGLYIAKIKGNEFGMFDLAESLYRDIGWLIAKDIPWHGKFNGWNTVKTLGKLATIGVAVYFAGTITWTGTFDLPWQWLGVNNTVQGLKIAAGLFFSTVAAVSTLVGLTASQRYFWNLSFTDNQIALSKELADSLPTIAPKARLRSDRETILVNEVEELRSVLANAPLPIVRAAHQAHARAVAALAGHPAPAPQVDEAEPRVGLALH